MTSLILTIRESARYRGRSGHWSWVAHRLSGLAILSFLIIHVWDTANATYAPNLYRWSIELFKHPLFGLGEVALMAAVLYHALNGTRISILDFKPEWWKYQRQSAAIVWALFGVAFAITGFIMLTGIFSHCADLAASGGSCWTWPRLGDYLQ